MNINMLKMEISLYIIGINTITPLQLEQFITDTIINLISNNSLYTHGTAP